jgi:multidrug efflux pump subunit AcrA (membrane-fusion protein)
VAPRSRRRDGNAGKPCPSHGAQTAGPVYLISKISSNAAPPHGPARYSRETDTPASDAGAEPATASVLAAAAAINVYDDLSGRISADRTVEIRPQAGGIILNRLFEEDAATARAQADLDRKPLALLRAIQLASGATAGSTT